MTKYIDADAVCYQLEKQEFIDGQPRAIRRARRIVAEFPSANVMPVRHERWIEDEDGDGRHCSGCGTDYCYVISDCENYSFCPNCGADMREVSDE